MSPLFSGIGRVVKSASALVLTAMFIAGCSDGSMTSTKRSIKPGSSDLTITPLVCTNNSGCSLATPVVSVSVSGSVATVTWDQVAGATKYTANCSASGATCVGQQPANIFGATNTTAKFDLGGNGTVQFKVKAHCDTAHGVCDEAHQIANGQNSKWGTATQEGGGGIDICVGDNCGGNQKDNVTITITCNDVQYNGGAQTPCTATSSDNESVTLVYTDNTNVGEAGVTGTTAGDNTHNPGLATSSFNITKAPSVVTVSCPASVQYNATAQSPCSASYSGVGPVSGSLTVSYTDNTNVGSAGASASWEGDANHTGDDDATTFEITKAPSVTVVSCPASVQYNATAQEPCTASYSGVGGVSGTLTVSYTDNTNVGTAGASASWGGDANHTGDDDASSFEITKAPSTVSISCPTAVTFNGSAQTPCTASYSGIGLTTTSLTVSYTNNTAVGTAGASASWNGDANHTGNSASATFQILAYNVAGCFMQPLYSSMPSTKSYQQKGSVLPIKCPILDVGGLAVANAAGDLLIEDLGVQSTLSATAIYSLPAVASKTVNSNAYKFTGTLYMNSQDTTDPFYKTGHLYRVTTKWNDNVSVSKGFVYVASK